MPLEVKAKFAPNHVRSLGVQLRFRRPRAPGMQRIPRGSFVRPRLGVITVLTDAVEDVGFAVPNRMEEMNQVVLGSALPAALHDERPEIEVIQPQSRCRLGDVFSMRG